MKCKYSPPPVEVKGTLSPTSELVRKCRGKDVIRRATDGMRYCRIMGKWYKVEVKYDM